MNEQAQKSEGDLSLWQVAGSVFSAFLGVQKQKNRERDMARGKPHQFVIIGLIGTILFVLILVGVVTLAMRLAGV